MGEAVYYIKAVYGSEEKAEAALQRVSEFTLQVSEAYHFWQANRGRSPAAFWPEFNNRFPLAAEFLREACGLNTETGDCNNALSGEISFGNGTPEVVNDEIRWCEETWHCASWSPLCRWMVLKFGALKAGYLSDEDGMDFYSLIEL